MLASQATRRSRRSGRVAALAGEAMTRDRRQGAGDCRDRRRPSGVGPGVRRAQCQGRAADHRHGDVRRVADQGIVRLLCADAGRRGQSSTSTGRWRRCCRSRCPTMAISMIMAIGATLRATRGGSGSPRAIILTHSRRFRQFLVPRARREAEVPLRSGQHATHIRAKGSSCSSSRSRQGLGIDVGADVQRRIFTPLRHDQHQPEMAPRFRPQPGRRLGGGRQGRAA